LFQTPRSTEMITDAIGKIAAATFPISIETVCPEAASAPARVAASIADPMSSFVASNGLHSIATAHAHPNETPAAAKSLEGADRMSNFEIQRLMSDFNQAETLSSSVQKKLDDTRNGAAQKIG
jgi:hypothetical protein